MACTSPTCLAKIMELRANLQESQQQCELAKIQRDHAINELAKYKPLMNVAAPHAIMPVTAKSDQTCCIYVSNIHQYVTVEHLFKLFDLYADINAITLRDDHAHIELTSTVDAERGMK
ncbi:uncharacterized protein LOC113212189 [Frankliniella occidentalis]|uniref:Uncharacterized protein LOC113212189 n=1 Tax=Frankliniella occidentalis TaxID=133901 RepID=A0A9C6XD41_FRAOC|nr:uncharacterized protein LOC113212189 [Frankliniella occidentalis]